MKTILPSLGVAALIAVGTLVACEEPTQPDRPTAEAASETRTLVVDGRDITVSYAFLRQIEVSPEAR